MRNSTNDFLDNRAPLFVISVIEGLGIIILNTVLLVVSCKIKKEIRNQLHIFYTFLGVSDLLNGSLLLVTSFTYFYKDFSLFHKYKFCFSIAVLAQTQMFITGYLLLLLTFVKFFSIITPLKCLKYVTREMAIRLSFGVWIFTSGLVIIPSLLWVQNQVYTLGQECDLYDVFGDKFGQFITLRKSAMGIFIFSLIILNSKIVMTIIKHNKRVGVLKGKLDTSTYKPDTKGVLRSKMDTSSSVEKLDRMFNMSVLEPGISGGQTTKMETFSFVDEPGTSHKKVETNNTENLSLQKRKISKSQVIIMSELESQTSEKRRIIKDPDQKSKTTTKQRLIGTLTYNFLKSKNFKAYLTVLMHVGFHLLSGIPSFVFLSNGQLLSYYTSSRSIRFVCALCRYFVSLIDPVLILLRTPVFRTTLKTLCSKCIQRQPKYY
ncbi:unnamed protein product [Mytilus edulis]|uniref:G-protein coupled receptors family 1 profile domain-containing protein n=1 Tax=Mytilus edulis TaxID=6550 RepID=A0A8S3RTM6_MYTED|nr:unnamed protein product [Mytilus edulis]